MRVLSCVIGASDNDEATGSFGAAMPTVSVICSGLNKVTLEGQNSTNTYVTKTFSSLVSLNDVKEVKVLTSGYQAEYGGNAGVSVNPISKSGTRDYHGTAYYFGRNANYVFNIVRDWLALCTAITPSAVPFTLGISSTNYFSAEIC